ncbi:DUF438 domain-containing protein [Enterococcus timonensis]|uniref:DUF438 domain-containing protein n=1 Tax=Enterococcus timonensis TaxID=1852364 RepID=UPI0008D96851|nr:DUF438 domain-containing protein [Enterococcus timonensis]
MNKLNTVERQKKIVEILQLLHQGGEFEEAKRIFNESFDGVDVTEITAAERELIQSGLNPTEIQKLCNVHAAVFKGSITDIHRSNYEHEQPGHPVHTLKLENRVITSLLNDEIREDFAKIQDGDWSQKERLVAALTDLLQIDKHYARKETLFFTYMEKYGISAPPKVMWGVDDRVREQIKDALNYLQSPKAAVNPLAEKLEVALTEIEEMIFKEEEIMIPMCLDVFSLDDWQKITEDSADIGYSFIPEPLPWKPSKDALAKEVDFEEQRQENIKRAKMTTDAIQENLPQTPEQQHFDWEQEENSAKQIVFETGILQLDQLLGLFQVLPVDLTFVDHKDRVKFYSEGHKRVFPRTKSVVGRLVVNCHPPKSMHVVQTILDDFRAGTRDAADFWIDLKGTMVYIRYFAVRDADQKYLGCLEVTQDITEIQKLKGTKRLLEEDAATDAAAEK